MISCFKIFNINGAPSLKGIFRSGDFPTFKCISLPPHRESKMKIAGYKSNVKNSAGIEVARCVSSMIYLS